MRLTPRPPESYSTTKLISESSTPPFKRLHIFFRDEEIFMRLLTSVVCVAVAAGILGGCSGGAVSPGAPTSLEPSRPVNVSGSIPKSYVLTDIGAELPGSPGLVPSGVNDKGTVVGEASVGVLGSLPSCSPSTCGPPQGWIFKNGTLSQLPPLGTDYLTFADSINSAGYVSGGSAGNVTEEAILWKPAGGTINLGTGILGSQSAAEAFSISNSGKIVGASANYTSEVPTAFDGKGGASAPCGATTQGLLNVVNNAGLAVGDMILSQGGVDAITCPPLTIIESPPDPTFWDYGFAINDKGQSVGRLSVGPAFGNFHPFLYRKGQTTDLGTLFPSDPDAVGAAFGINQSGMIVGFTAQNGGTPGHPPVDPRAFVYAQGKMVDLNSLLSSEVQAQWTVVVAEKINNKKQVIAAAWYGGYPNGVEHAVLLSPSGSASSGVTRTRLARGGRTLTPALREAGIRFEAMRARRLHLDR
jgi:probable HAF family extracellular repeat protein